MLNYPGNHLPDLSGVTEQIPWVQRICLQWEDSTDTAAHDQEKQDHGD